MENMLSKSIVINDGTELQYLESSPTNKHPQTIVMIPGGGQSADEFKYQYNQLHEQFHIIAINMRGHGNSSDPGFGYTVARFAKDLFEVLTILNLQDIILMGHSLGCAIIWCYFLLFNRERLSKLIFIDEPPCALINPIWTEEQQKIAGATFTFESLFNMTNGMRSPYGKKMLSTFIDMSTTKSFSAQKKQWLIDCMLKMPLKRMADIFFDNIIADWRSIIPKIDLPSLIIGGKCSITPWESQQWIHEQIAGSQLEIFACNEGGSHFMFIENYSKFNYLLLDFIQR